MILLDASTKTLELLLDSAPSTEFPWTSSYVDHSSTTASYVNTNGTSNSTSAVSFVGAPPTGIDRQLKMFSLYNAANAPRTVTIRYNDNGSLRTLHNLYLAAGETAMYVDSSGMSVITAGGLIRQAMTMPVSAAGGSLTGMYPNPTIVDNISSIESVGTGDVTTTSTTYTPLLKVNAGANMETVFTVPYAGMFALAEFTCVAKNVQALTYANTTFRMTLDGVEFYDKGNNMDGASYWRWKYYYAVSRVALVTAGSHTIAVGWKVASSTGSINRATEVFMGGELTVQFSMPG